MKKINDFLEWVGGCYYKTINDFVNEAEKQGIRRRIAYIPSGFIPGISRCFLAHLQTKMLRICSDCKVQVPKYKRKCTKCGSKNIDVLKVQCPVIFGFYIIGGVELIIEDESKIHEIEKYKKEKGIRPVTISETISEERRLCGKRNHIGAIYFYNDEDFEILYKYVESIGSDKVEIRGSLVLLKNPVPTKLKFFRGVKRFNPAKHDPPIKLPSLPKKIVVDRVIRLIKSRDLTDYI